jgi:type IV secretory pathway TrbD component
MDNILGGALAAGVVLLGFGAWRAAALAFGLVVIGAAYQRWLA